MYRCEKGCRNPKSGKPKWHRSVVECLYEPRPGYSPPAPADTPEKKAAPIFARQEPEKPAISVGIKTPFRPGTIQFSDTPAEVVKTGGAHPLGDTTPEEVDYIIDGPHTRAIWDLGYGGIRYVCLGVDEYLEYKTHIPDRFFHLTPFEITSIEADPRNAFSRAGTWVCKRIFRCKTLDDAHHAIDTAVFFSAFGGLGYAIFTHYRAAWKESPKLIRNRAKKAERAKALKIASADHRFPRPESEIALAP
jgi:hypothetical protein